MPPAKDPVGVLPLAGAILQQHLAAGKDSPIRGAVQAELTAAAADISAAEADHAQAKEPEKRREEIYERRNNRVARIQPVLPRVSKGLQSARGPASPHQMGHKAAPWTTRPAPKSPPKSSAGPGPGRAGRPRARPVVPGFGGAGRRVGGQPKPAAPAPN